jgi:hypothetical protein
MLIDANFASTSEVRTSDAWHGWISKNRRYDVDVAFKGKTLLLNFIQIYEFVQKLLGKLSDAGKTHTAWQTVRQTKYLSHMPNFTFKESTLKRYLGFNFTLGEAGTLHLKSMCY